MLCCVPLIFWLLHWSHGSLDHCKVAKMRRQLGRYIQTGETSPSLLLSLVGTKASFILIYIHNYNNYNDPPKLERFVTFWSFPRWSNILQPLTGGCRNRLTICQIRYKKKTNSETVTLSMPCQSLCHCSLSTFVEVVEGRHQKKGYGFVKINNGFVKFDVFFALCQTKPN